MSPESCTSSFRVNIIVQMQNLALPSSGTISRVYVIFRVFNLSSRDVDMEIFVDPIRFRGSHLDFEVQTWVGKVRDASNMSR